MAGNTKLFWERTLCRRAYEMNQSLLTAVSLQAVPVPTNKDGSILTLFSADGLEFGFIFFAR